MKVLVTGGSGFVGKNLKQLKPNWIYISSKDYDLLCYQEVMRMLDIHKPDVILHLAGIVGGIKKNNQNQASFYYENNLMNMNVIHGAFMSKIPKVLSSLSTCAFPDTVEDYPFTEEDLLNGPPAMTNFTYGYAKRNLYVMSNAYRKQYNCNFSTYCPSNIYGPNDNFDLEDSHFVSAMIKKFHEAKDSLEFWGTGKPLRQQLYVEDLCKIIIKLVEVHNSDIPLIVAPNENLSIKEMIETCKKISNKNIDIKFNGQLDGQFRKDGSNKKLLELIGNFKFTSFEDGLQKTYKWYGENH